MTEDQIERAVERKTDAVDALLMARKLSQAEYDSRMAEIAAWADQQYNLRSLRAM